MLRSFTRIAVAGAAAATMLAGTASPALAADTPQLLDSDITLNDSHGYLQYIDNVDVFKICDTNADGHGVHGILNGPGGNIWHIDDGGDSGCDKKAYDIGGNTYSLTYWWAGDVSGTDQYSREFSE